MTDVNQETITGTLEDLATQRIQSYPFKTKASYETEKVSKFLEPSYKPQVISLH